MSFQALWIISHFAFVGAARIDYIAPWFREILKSSQLNFHIIIPLFTELNFTEHSSLLVK